MTADLVQSVGRAEANPGTNVAFKVQRRDFMDGTWLRHVQASPFYQRLFRPECMHYERRVNPISVPNGPVGTLEGYLDHFPFSKGIEQWLSRHNSYSRFEAEQIIENRRLGSRFSLAKALLSNDFHERRYHQKEAFYRMPARPVVKFLLLYLLKRGFLDGKAGFTYSVLQSFYEYMIVLKTREMETARTEAITQLTV